MVLKKALQDWFLLVLYDSGWGPRDGATRWLETLSDMAQKKIPVTALLWFSFYFFNNGERDI